MSLIAIEQSSASGANWCRRQSNRGHRARVDVGQGRSQLFVLWSVERDGLGLSRRSSSIGKGGRHHGRSQKATDETRRKIGSGGPTRGLAVAAVRVAAAGDGPCVRGFH